jgi:hypothetical protein
MFQWRPAFSFLGFSIGNVLVVGRGDAQDVVFLYAEQLFERV